MQKEEKGWYAQWFDTPYYHILYKDRDYAEAQLFMDNVTQYLNLPDDAKVLDLACGKGRHSLYLNQLGFDVTGADLSENSILAASAHAGSKLRFCVHDMREPFAEKYDAVFNLFTSFGYFDDENDNLKTLLAIKNSLNEFGFAVLDFMNVDFVMSNLVAHEEKLVDGILFKIHRYTKDGFIFKEIGFEDAGAMHHYTERVRALQLSDFEAMMEEAGIFLLDIFGDYKLRKYDPKTSERLIMIFK